MNLQNIKIVIYSSKSDSHFHRVANELQSLNDTISIDHCHTTDAFSASIQEVMLGFGIVLIFVRDLVELNAVLQFQKKLLSHYVVMILDETVNEHSHEYLKILPRYMTNITDDYKDMFQIIRKIVFQIQTRERRKA